MITKFLQEERVGVVSAVHAELLTVENADTA